jgi:hypothetical protein
VHRIPSPHAHRVEIENSGESGIGAGFVVEKVDVNIDGEGAKTTIIGWGDGGFSSDAAKKMFPLRIGPLAWYNLLYAVSFLRSPEEMDAFSFARAAGVGGPPQSDLQRAVTTNKLPNLNPSLDMSRDLQRGTSNTIFFSCMSPSNHDMMSWQDITCS